MRKRLEFTLKKYFIILPKGPCPNFASIRSEKNNFICWLCASHSGLIDQNDLLKVSIWNEFFRTNWCEIWTWSLNKSSKFKGVYTWGVVFEHDLQPLCSKFTPPQATPHANFRALSGEHVDSKKISATHIGKYSEHWASTNHVFRNLSKILYHF